MKTAFNLAIAVLAILSAQVLAVQDAHLLEAQQVALEVSGQLRPLADLTQQILNDLAVIRAAFPEVAGIRYRPRAAADEIIVGLTDEAAEQFQAGQYHALDELNELYGVIEIRPHLGSLVSFILLRFNQVYNTELLADIYEQASPEGLRYAESNYTIGDGPTIYANPPRYTFRDAWGDCPAGCTGEKLWHFRVENGQAIIIPGTWYVDAVKGRDIYSGLIPSAPMGTIQRAINQASDGDTVIIAPGRYTGPGNRDITINKPITVRSIDPNDPNIVSSTIIDCNSSQTDNHWGVRFFQVESPAAALAGLTITNGYVPVGGGIRCERSSPSISNCNIVGNYAAQMGGGIYLDSGSPTVADCVISGNASRSGGGVVCRFTRATISRCLIMDNYTEKSGGGIFVEQSDVNFSGCIFAANRATMGQAVLCSASDANFSNCTFANNSSTGHEGTVVCSSSVFGSSRVLSITNCILRNGGNEIRNSDRSTIVVTYSNVQGGQPGVGNIDEDPQFVFDGDYRLSPDSPCIDAGDPNYAAADNETDLEGNPRVTDGDRDGRVIVDMGAYEYVPPIEAKVNIVPRVLNLKSKGNWLLCSIRLPNDYSVVDIDIKSVILQGQIKPRWVWACRHQKTALAVFDRDHVQAILTVGENELTVTGRLNNGRELEGSDTIKVICGPKGPGNRGGKK
jgi:hypothetical protein